MDGYIIDIELLRRFEAGLNPLEPHESAIPAKIIGYGEISTIFEILDPSMKGLAFKRLPIFRTEEETASFEHLFAEYNRVLKEDIGISVPRYATVRVNPKKGNKVVYCIQEKLAEGSICNQLLHRLDRDSNLLLFRAVLQEMKKLWEFNRSGGVRSLAVDSQISNWALECESPPSSLNGKDIRLIYIDTSTPLMRIDGHEQLNTELFLRSSPSFLVPFIKRFFLQDIISRYYDHRLAVVDIIANIFKEQRKDLVEPFINEANRFLSAYDARHEEKPITLKELRSYYREDKFIWSLFLGFRRLDRFLHVHILKRPYAYILPGEIRR